MISKIKYKSEEFSYPVFEYLYPYLVKLVWRKKLQSEVGGATLIITEEFVDEFKCLLKGIIIELLDEFYVEPKEKDLLEYKGRYEKIELNNNNYILNIATNGKDKVVFQIFSLFDWIRKINHKT